MGIPITITEEVIAKACRVSANGRFIWNSNRTHPFLESYKGVVLKGNSSTKLVDIEGQHRMLLKFMMECFFHKGGGSDQPSNDHKLVGQDQSSKIYHAPSVLDYQRRYQK